MAVHISLLGALALTGFAVVDGQASNVRCAGAVFRDSLPTVQGVQITDVVAKEVSDWNEWATSVPATPILPVQPRSIDFCQVHLTYTHPGLNDSLQVEVWLPHKQQWNGRFLGQGGGGWAAGGAGSSASGVAMGFAVAQTNAGNSYMGPPQQTQLDSSTWGLISTGNVNLNALRNNAYQSLDELAIIAKHTIKTYYEKDIKHSYWNGCSTGGRQGLMLAQRYPTHFDGILSSAPSQNWATFLVTEHWPHVKMRELNYYPAPCELNAITAAAVKKCDELDGVADGIVASRSCKLEPKELVGHKYTCGDNKDERKITKQAVEIAEAVWFGPIKNGKPVWHGLSFEASLPGIESLYGGLASTRCDENNKNCKSAPFSISADYIKTWLAKDSNFDLDTVDEKKFYELLRASRQEYAGFLDTSDPDLEPFKNAGGKIIQWHGLADQLIPPNGSLNYYLRVKEQVGETTDDFYRYFEAPGVAHCFGGNGAYPTASILALQDWVEKGIAPDSLIAESMPAFSANPSAAPHRRPLCPWPKVQQYVGGNVHLAESFVCAPDHGKKRPGAEDLKVPVAADGGKDEL